MMLNVFSTGAGLLLLLWFTSLLPSDSRDPREGNPFALVCVFTHAHADQLFIQTLLLKSCEYLLYALGCWFAQFFGEGGTHFPVAPQDSFVSSVLSPGIFFGLVLILDFRVSRCLKLGWGIFLQALGT